MKRLLILSMLTTVTVFIVSAQENPVVVPDTMKLPADSVMITADTVSVLQDTIMVSADTIIVTQDSVKIPADTAVIAAESVVIAPEKEKVSQGSDKIPMNMVKFNITAALIKNYSLQYERVLSRTVSMAISGGYMPETNIPYTKQIFKWADITDPDEQEIIENMLVTNSTITPEIRFYAGKKRYGSGFYLSLYYRYGQHSFSNVLVDYENDLGETGTLNCWGDATSHTGGFMLGAQWSLGRHVCLDWWILGPHFGISSGNFEALSSLPLSEQDQQDIEDSLNDIDIPMFEQTVNVTSEGATMTFDGPWGGIRAGLSLGIKF